MGTPGRLWDTVVLGNLGRLKGFGHSRDTVEFGGDTLGLGASGVDRARRRVLEEEKSSRRGEELITTPHRGWGTTRVLRFSLGVCFLDFGSEADRADWHLSKNHRLWMSENRALFGIDCGLKTVSIVGAGVV